MTSVTGFQKMTPDNRATAPRHFVLAVIVAAQFFCTSLWFAGNAINNDIVHAFQLDPHFLAHLTSSIQFGFISGTLVFAILSIADRFSPSVVFFVSAMLAGLCNLGLCLPNLDGTEILMFRFATGFFLAGIYPVGMKIAADYFQEGLGKSLGFLVGALVLGTAFPHLLKDLTSHFPWKYVLYGTTALSVIGGVIILLLVPNGPYLKQGQKLHPTSFLDGFKNAEFRAVAFGYFGHMWELYTFWAFVPVILTTYNHFYPATHFNVPFYSFLIIASGGFSCVLAGLLSQRFGARKIATVALALSCCCCLLSPFFLLTTSPHLLVLFLFFWSLVVIADSPLFSSLVAANAPPATKGTSLTIVNCIGFSITILSIQTLNSLYEKSGAQYVYLLLAVGPILGLIALLHKSKRPSA